MLETNDAALRRFVADTLQRIAPTTRTSGLDPTVPLRDQVDLDSLDWLNFVHALEDGLGVEILPRDYAALTTLDALYGYLAAARAVPATHRAAAVGMHRLADGRTVTVRPIAPNDADRVRHFLEVTSPQSRYTRFHAFVAAPSATLVHFLTDLDAERGQAFVCAVGASTAEAIVGEARYVATDEPGVCELGILIEDDWQHSGIAGLLMEAVIDGARERGYRTMEGLVLAQNAPMLRFAHALGFALDYLPGDRRTVRIVLDLGTHRAAQPRTSANAGDRCASSDDKR